MLPEFPKFKKLELSDRQDIESITSRYDPYSDFNFISMWSWNIDDEFQVCLLNNNLVVRLNDYVTGAPLYSFLGEHKTTETVETLLGWLVENGVTPRLELMPEISVKNLDQKKFKVTEQREHFDYIISVERLLPHDGTTRRLSSRRRLIQKFKETNDIQLKKNRFRRRKHPR